jgi:hypothetical protein
MTNLFANRLANLGALIQKKGLDISTKTISGSNTRAIEDLLMPVSGVGPRVIANFYLLRGLTRR